MYVLDSNFCSLDWGLNNIDTFGQAIGRVADLDSMHVIYGLLTVFRIKNLRDFTIIIIEISVVTDVILD